MLALLLLAAAPTAAHGLTAAQLDGWLAKLDRDKHLPAAVSVHAVGGRPVFTALALDNPAKTASDVRPGLTVAEFNALVPRRAKDGFRLACIAPYGARIAAVWVKDEVRLAARYGLSGDDYQTFFEEQTKAGLWPASVTGYLDGRSSRYAAVFLNRGTDGAAHHGLSAADFERRVADYAKNGRRPSWLSGFTDGKEPRFNVLLVKDKRPGVTRLGMDAAALTKAMADHAKAGRELVALGGYATADGGRYVASWVEARKTTTLAVTGTEVPALAGFDQAMLAFMAEREIEAGTLAVMRGGKIVLSRGYGSLTREGKTPVPPDAPFRLASVTKPITAALVRDLAARGKLKLSDPAFGLIGIDLPPGATADPRLKTVTVQQLLDHKGGFDRDAKPLGEPVLQAALIRKTLKLKDPPTPADFVRFMNGRKLDFDPGSKSVYSNYGYCVLGRVIEKASGEPYPEAVKRFLAPLEIKSVGLGRTRPEDRDPREPFYYEPGLAADVIRGTGSVPWPDGGFVLEMMDSHGGLIGSAPDVARFLGNHGQTGTAFGRLPGTWAMARRRADGVCVVALFNQSSGPDFAAIQKLSDEAADGVKKWP